MLTFLINLSSLVQVIEPIWALRAGASWYARNQPDSSEGLGGKPQNSRPEDRGSPTRLTLKYTSIELKYSLHVLRRERSKSVYPGNYKTINSPIEF